MCSAARTSQRVNYVLLSEPPYVHACKLFLSLNWIICLRRVGDGGGGGGEEVRRCQRCNTFVCIDYVSGLGDVCSVEEELEV